MAFWWVALNAVIFVFLLGTSNNHFIIASGITPLVANDAQVEISIQVLKRKACHYTPLYSAGSKSGGYVVPLTPSGGAAHGLQDPVQVVLAGPKVASGTHAGIHLGPPDAGCQN